MNLYKFNADIEAEQLEAVWSGNHMDCRADEVNKILMNQVDGFYLNIFYQREYNIIRRVRGMCGSKAGGGQPPDGL